MDVRKRDWYRKSFGVFYPAIYAHRDDEAAAREADMIVSLLGLENADARILDLCCGGGRHAAALSRKGLRVYGLDLSDHLLGHASNRKELKRRLVRADMKHLPFSRKMNVVLNLFTSFGYFPDDEENRSVIREISSILIPGGRLLIDHMNPSVVRRSSGSSVRDAGPFHLSQVIRIEGNRVVKDVTITDGEMSEDFREDVRMYEREEMKDLLEGEGFDDVRIYGSLDGSELAEESQRMIIVGTCTEGT